MQDMLCVAMEIQQQQQFYWFSNVQNWHHPQIAQANRGGWWHQNYNLQVTAQTINFYNAYTKINILQ